MIVQIFKLSLIFYFKVCEKPQKNTSITRLASHRFIYFLNNYVVVSMNVYVLFFRKVCGTSSIRVLSSNRNSSGETIDNKSKIEKYEECDDIEYEFADEPSQTESVVLPSVFEIVNEDIKRHLPKNPLATKVKLDTQRELDTALSSFLISCNLTFSMVDNKHFRNFVRTLNNGYRLPTSMKLKSDTIDKIQQSGESNKRQRLQSTDSDDDNYN